MLISVFGGSQSKPGDETYQQAYLLGRLLAQAGHSVMTGGYIGTMEAVSRGAAESGAHVIGVTCDEIERWRPVGANQWVKEERRFPTLRERLFYLIENCDAAIALPGGIGTLAEISEMWSHMQSRAIAIRPLVLIGQGWKDTLNMFIMSFSEFIPQEYRRLVKCAETIEEALALLEADGDEI